MSHFTRLLLVLMLCTAGLALWLWGVNNPYTGLTNANNNYLSLAAKNYIRFGFTGLKLFPTYFAGRTLPSPVPYYLHHPVLVYLLSAVPFMLFGFHNWVVHAANFLFLLGDIFLIYTIGKFVWNRKVGLWAAGLAMIFPMTSFFWKYIFFEQGSLFFNLLIFYCFVRYLKVQKPVYLLALFFSAVYGFHLFAVPLALFVCSHLFASSMIFAPSQTNRSYGSLILGGLTMVGLYFLLPRRKPVSAMIVEA